MTSENPNNLETKEKLPRLGMLISQLNTETLRDVLIIYDKVCGGRVNELALDKFANPLEYTIDNIKDRLKNSNAADYRYGSKLKGDERMNAKLVIWRERGSGEEMTIRFSFDPNIISGYEADQMVKDFQREVNKLLEDRGLGINLSN